MIKQQIDKNLLKLRELKSDKLTYDNCYKQLKKYLSEQDSYFKNSDNLNGIDPYEFLGIYCGIEMDLKIKLWGEYLDRLKTINDLTLIIYHELLYKK